MSMAVYESRCFSLCQELLFASVLYEGSMKNDRKVALGLLLYVLYETDQSDGGILFFIINYLYDI